MLVSDVQPIIYDAERVLRYEVIDRKHRVGADSDVGSRYAERIFSVAAAYRQRNVDIMD